MDIFRKKVKLEDVCRDFYDKAYINPKVGAVDASKVFYEVSRKNLIEVDKHFEKITLENLTKESTKEAEELNITDKESIQRANHRLWSGEAWRQKKLHISLVYIFCKH